MLLLPAVLFTGCAKDSPPSGSNLPGLEEKLQILQQWEDGGPPAENVIVDLNKVTVNLLGARKYDEADIYSHRLLDVTRRDLGRDHPMTLSALNNVGAMYYIERRYSEAEPIFKEVLAGRKRALGKKHPDTRLSVANLAEIYKAQGRDKEAEWLIRSLKAR